MSGYQLVMAVIRSVVSKFSKKSTGNVIGIKTKILPNGRKFACRASDSIDGQFFLDFDFFVELFSFRSFPSGNWKNQINFVYATASEDV